MTHAHKIIDCTGETSTREKEIKKYIDSHNVGCYCVLDDETLNIENHVKPLSDIGITEQHVNECIKILGAEKKMCELCNGYGYYTTPNGVELNQTVYEYHNCKCHYGILKGK
ncbi:MAG: hypothetical protein [Caudoviricetes sp.]|nr:MAG: hypothetical protein [Caudoviricetes sp.]